MVFKINYSKQDESWKKRIHFCENEFYLCNKKVNACELKMTKDIEKVTCRNCLFIIGKIKKTINSIKNDEEKLENNSSNNNAKKEFIRRKKTSANPKHWSEEIKRKLIERYKDMESD